ncbi:MAG: formate dehydrogenase accessory sulfurtransferase FdhD [Saprospiraceae bacterium]|nr:formate dehydrogenase accessory sulfurtransferase FdhD [Saprospiraceae bacterium]
MEPIKKIRIIKISETENKHIDDWVAVEEPLEIQLQYGPLENRVKKSISITMRTPGDDVQLALGFLLNEGIIRHSHEVLKCSLQTFHRGELNPNIITASLHPDVSLHSFNLERHFYTSSSCGLCGKASIEAVQSLGLPQLPKPTPIVSIKTINTLPTLLREHQQAFDATGGIHATALFDSYGHLIHAAEDVGRHNAMDKLSGWCMQNEHNLTNKILLLSGRASFELIQKAAVTGIPIVAAVGAPSSLAVQTAGACNITLLGFTKSTSANIYTHPERLTGL